MTGLIHIQQHARANIEKWGRQDVETLALCIAEEAGEVAQAVLQARWENGRPTRIVEEAVDLAALCLQIIQVVEVPDD